LRFQFLLPACLARCHCDAVSPRGNSNNPELSIVAFVHKGLLRAQIVKKPDVTVSLELRFLRRWLLVFCLTLPVMICGCSSSKDCGMAKNGRALVLPFVCVGGVSWIGGKKNHFKRKSFYGAPLIYWGRCPLFIGLRRGYWVILVVL